jgi:hypothetical protein
VAAIATNGGDPCYKRRWMLLQIGRRLAARSPARSSTELPPTTAARCYKSGATLLQGVRRGRRRCYHQRPPPVATNRVPPWCKEFDEAGGEATCAGRWCCRRGRRCYRSGQRFAGVGGGPAQGGKQRTGFILLLLSRVGFSSIVKKTRCTWLTSQWPNPNHWSETIGRVWTRGSGI